MQKDNNLFLQTCVGSVISASLMILINVNSRQENYVYTTFFPELLGQNDTSLLFVKRMAFKDFNLVTPRKP